MLDRKTVAKRLGVCEKTVDRLRDLGQLKAYRIGRCVRFKEEDLEKYLRKRRE